MVNLLPLKTGGGVQVALDFLDQAALYGKKHRWLIVCREHMPFLKGTAKNIQVVCTVKDNLQSRMFFEKYYSRNIIKTYRPDVIYTQFGPHWGQRSSVPNVVGCAYSNLFYPEIDFWGRLPFTTRLWKRFIDSMRRGSVLSADCKIFETEDLARRAIDQYALDPDSVYYVKPAASSLVTPEKVHKETKNICKSIPNGYRILLLCGYHPNKNIDTAIKALAEICRRGEISTYLVLTLPENLKGTKQLLALAKDLDVVKNIVNLGPVPQEGCVELYKTCDISVLPSTLESFSNVIAESWNMGIPLLMTDMDWSRSMGGQGAMYFLHRDWKDLADKILKIKKNDELKNMLVDNGCKELKKYSSPKQRFLQYQDILERVVNGN